MAKGATCRRLSFSIVMRNRENNRVYINDTMAMYYMYILYIRLGSFDNERRNVRAHMYSICVRVCARYF